MRLPSQFQILSRAVKGRHANRINALMATSSDKEFAVLFFKILPYFKSMKKRKEVIVEVKETAIRIVHIYPERTSAK